MGANRFLRMLSDILLLSQTGRGNLSLWDLTRCVSSLSKPSSINHSTLQPISTARTNTQTYSKAFLIDPWGVPLYCSKGNDEHASSGPLYCMAATSNNRSMGLFDIARTNSSTPLLTVGEAGKLKGRSAFSSFTIEYCTPNHQFFLVLGLPSSTSSLARTTLNDAGWIVGGNSLPCINRFYCLLGYQCFGGSFASRNADN